MEKFKIKGQILSNIFEHILYNIADVEIINALYKTIWILNFKMEKNIKITNWYQIDRIDMQVGIISDGL